MPLLWEAQYLSYSPSLQVLPLTRVSLLTMAMRKSMVLTVSAVPVLYFPRAALPADDPRQ
jgi:hypothetical protein